MDDVAERVPICNVLGVFLTVHRAVPDLDSPRGADEWPTHCQQDSTGDQDHSYARADCKDPLT